LQWHSADESALQSAIARGENHFGQLDGLILNAATLDPLGRIDNPDISLDSWKHHFDVNLFSLVPAIRTSLPALRESKGRIIFISSGAATGNIPGWAPYNASKAAMNSLSR
jgi:NAD(P)-dependent dehydrogenase (short-subunit alcohol dehydrogenase family)